MRQDGPAGMMGLFCKANMALPRGHVGHCSRDVHASREGNGAARGEQVGERYGLLSLKRLAQREGYMQKKGPDVIVQGRKWGCFVGGAEGTSLFGLPGSIKADWACWTNFKWNGSAVLG